MARQGLDALLAALTRRGYAIIGPVVRDGAIVLDQVEASADLPIGWTDDQDAGSYELRRRDDDACFGHVVGPHSFKRFQLPAEQRLFSAHRGAGGTLTVEAEDDPPQRLAFLGARSCDLHAMGILGAVLGSGPAPDPRRDETFIVAVQCGEAGGTCFCSSMGTGPRAQSGFDIALTEVIDTDGHWFAVETGSPAGAEVLAELPVRPASDAEAAAAAGAPERAAAEMGRTMPTDDLPGLLMRNLEHPRWEAVAERCLSCASCTMACPTCFCVEVADTGDAAGSTAERTQRWASCFTVDHAYLNGGSVRPTTRSRYRQWMTHKLSTWWDQFDSSGCVGCGRCITWCPAAIDITEEVAAIRATDGAIVG
jgi:ferredoxin